MGAGNAIRDAAGRITGYVSRNRLRFASAGVVLAALLAFIAATAVVGMLDENDVRAVVYDGFRAIVFLTFLYTAMRYGYGMATRSLSKRLGGQEVTPEGSPGDDRDEETAQ